LSFFISVLPNLRDKVAGIGFSGLQGDLLRRRPTTMMSDWTRGLRLALRTLLRTPGFTVLAVGTLGLAIGANAGIFSVVDAVLLDPLPYADSDRLVYVAGSAPGSDFPEEFPLAAEFFVQYREESRLIEELSTFNSFTNTLRVGDRIERVRMCPAGEGIKAFVLDAAEAV
jgi:hypothetical protein